MRGDIGASSLMNSIAGRMSKEEGESGKNSQEDLAAVTKSLFHRE
jgi:hypothetical protein